MRLRPTPAAPSMTPSPSSPSSSSSSSSSSPSPAPEAAFSAWLTQALRSGADPASLAPGAQLFAAAAGDSTLRQAQNAFIQVVAHLDQHRPALKDAFFAVVQPSLVAKAKAEGDDVAVADLEAGVVRFVLDVPDAVLAAANAAAGARVDALLDEFDREFDAKTRATTPTTPTPTTPAQNAARTSTLLAARGGKSVEAIGAVAGAPARASDAQWGAFLGRVLSNVVAPAESALLQKLAAAGRVDVALQSALSGSGIFAGVRGGNARMAEIAAAFAFAKNACYAPQDLGDDGRALLASLAQSDPMPTASFTPPMTTKDGDLEALLLRFLGVTVPRLKTAAVKHHPHIPEAKQLVGTAQIADAVAAEHGKFLAGYNVMTVMHQLGSAPPWLDLLHDKLGLEKSQYLGVCVPYSTSEVALARLNLDGWRTRDDHDPRDPFTAKLQDTLGAGNPTPFDALKEENIKSTVGEMIEMHQRNGKPIFVIDDGGYVIHAIRKHYPEHEEKFRIVEWTTRGIRKLEQVPDVKIPVVAAAETAPKNSIEPPFVADSTVLHFLAAVEHKMGGLNDKRILVVGAGYIGKAVAHALKELGAHVSVHDRDPAKLVGLADGLVAAKDVRVAVKGKDAILAATGANSLGGDVLGFADPGTLITSASSVDIETRDEVQWKNGHWSTDLVRATLHVDEAGNSRLEEKTILGGGFVLNLSRRARIMPLDREELILMNVTEALAVAHTSTAKGKVKVEPWREERITQTYAKAYPAAYARAMAFQD
jgi:hypothetical protein